jgi:hypothetical protein
LIAEKEIDCVFNERVIAEMAKCIKAPPDAIARFRDNVRAGMRAYFAELARTDWKAIEKQIRNLYRVANSADQGSDAAAARLADCIGSVDQATSNWLERCADHSFLFPSHGPLWFPSSDEIRDPGTRRQAIRQWRYILSYGQERVEGRKRPSGKRSRPSFRPWLRLPHSGRGRPRDLAARELVQHLALTYTEATGRRPPHCVNSRSQGPFFRLVLRCFKEARITDGSVVKLINDREIQREEFERLHHWRSSYGLASEG